MEAESEDGVDGRARTGAGAGARRVGATDADSTARQVGAIVERAEAVAREIAAEAEARAATLIADAQARAAAAVAAAETRAAQRIAEADRAAEFRVTAAEEEAAEILSGAEARVHEAEGRALASGTATATRLREEAAQAAEKAAHDVETAARETAERARAEAARLKEDADRYEKIVRAGADAKARDLTRDARVVSRDVLTEGTEVSEQLRQLAGSLYRNADRLLRDVKLTHARLTSTLDRTVPPERGGSRRGSDGAGVGDDDLDVPEFITRP